jgi:hypothetical protein
MTLGNKGCDAYDQEVQHRRGPVVPAGLNRGVNRKAKPAGAKMTTNQPMRARKLPGVVNIWPNFIPLYPLRRLATMVVPEASQQIHGL